MSKDRDDWTWLGILMCPVIIYVIGPLVILFLHWLGVIDAGPQAPGM